MKAGGAIINTTSVNAYKGHPTLIDYTATKGAVVAFTRALHAQVVGRGIRVNAVAPGPVWTPLIPSSFPEEKVVNFGKNVPMGRAGQPHEIAPSFVFLASGQDSSYIAGQVLHPNGKISPPPPPSPLRRNVRFPHLCSSLLPCRRGRRQRLSAWVLSLLPLSLELWDWLSDTGL